MNVLGIHSYIHDSGACLVNDDGIVAICEERLSGIKYDASFPRKSIEYVMNAADVRDINKIDLVVFDLFERQGNITHLGILQTGYQGDCVSIRHHDSHAASAYFASPFDEAAVLIVDGAGSLAIESPPGQPQHYLADSAGRMQEVQSFYRAAGGRFHLIRRTFTTGGHAMGIGFLYGVASEYLGFGKLEGGKLMGLAAYGRAGAGEFRRPAFENHSGDLVIPFDQRLLESEDWAALSAAVFGGVRPRRANEPLQSEHEDLARYVQDETEAAMLEIARHLFDITRCPRLCMAGGVALNGLANERILGETSFEEMFVQPASGDSGCAIGNALYGRHVVAGAEKRFEMKHAFLGRAYDVEDVDAALAGVDGVSVTKADIPAVASEIASGRIVGWFEGGSEAGPRALGHRSILADPRRADMKDALNRRVKRRETFRPYAPAVLEERTGEYFDFTGPSPFMLRIGGVRPGRAAEIPAVTHIDGTARIQTVPKGGGRLREIIEAFDAIAGVPMLLNTSFNVAGRPIVETPADAVKCFMETDMDLLYIEGLLVRKTG